MDESEKRDTQSAVKETMGGMASRETAPMILGRRIEGLRREAEGLCRQADELEALYAALPRGLNDLADRALYNLLMRADMGELRRKLA